MWKILIYKYLLIKIKPVFISKNWVVGRSLDSIADNLHIQNKNNVTNESLEKLNILNWKIIMVVVVLMENQN